VDTNPTYEVADLLKEKDFEVYYLVVSVGIDVLVWDSRQNRTYPLPANVLSNYLDKVS